MKLLSGRDEIAYLLEKSLDKYENDNQKTINRNTNRKNYTPLAKVLSEISNQLPHTSEEKKHDKYEPSLAKNEPSYPHRKYDITGGQIKDAYKGIVENPSPYLIDACYIYLYGVGRKGFQENPVDKNLLAENFREAKNEDEVLEKKKSIKRKNTSTFKFPFLMAIVLAIIGFVMWYLQTQENSTLKENLMVLPYEPTSEEIAYLEGVWSYYTSTPQARANEQDRYHKIVNNVMEITYKDGYFTFKRHGATINHSGYIQYNSPGVISIHSYVNKKEGGLESPSHSLAKIDKNQSLMYAISATWTFESEGKSDIIGVRNVYVKEGDKGNLKEIKNTPKNASCRCKVVRWTKSDETYQDFELKYQKLEQSPQQFLQPILDENSILLKQPKPGVLISKP